MLPSANVSEIDGGPLTNDHSVFSHIEQGLKKSPDKPAVICMHQPADQLDDLLVEQEASGSNGLDCLSLTYAQLHRAALRLASGLHANGVEPGSKILFMIPNGGEYALLLWTCIVGRLTFTSLDPADALVKNTQPGLEVFRSTIAAIQPSAIMFAADSIDPAALATAIDAEHLSRRPLLISMRQINTNGAATGYMSLASLARDGGDGASLVEAARNDDPDRLHSIIFTSGTSGRPKGCPLRAGGTTHMLHSWSWLIHAGNCARALQQAHNARGIAPANTVQTWREGGAVVMSSGGRGFDIDDLLDAIRRCGVTFVVLTPPMVHELALKLASSSSSLPSLDSVKTVQLGGDAVTKDVMIKCASMFPRADICINHGMTEGGACFRWPFLGRDVGSIPFLGQACPVGEVAPGAVARIWDADNGRIMPRRQPGELHLSSNSIIKGYLSGESASSFYEDGGRSWFITGDVAMMDDDGLVYILGRSKDMIKSPRGIVMPSVIESCIESLLDSQTCVVAITRPGDVNEVPFAVSRSFRKTTEDEILHHVESQLGEAYCLGGAILLSDTGLPEFPVNQTHKIDKAKLRQTVMRYLGNRVNSWGK